MPRHFVPTVVIISLVTFLVWLILCALGVADDLMEADHGMFVLNPFGLLVIFNVQCRKQSNSLLTQVYHFRNHHCMPLCSRISHAHCCDGWHRNWSQQWFVNNQIKHGFLQLTIVYPKRNSYQGRRPFGNSTQDFSSHF